MPAPGLAAQTCFLRGSVPRSLAVGRAGKQAAQKQVPEGGVRGRQMLLFGAGRWSWALVWVTVGREDRPGVLGRERGNRRQEGRGE